MGVPTCLNDTFLVWSFNPFNISYAPKNFSLFSSAFFVLPTYLYKLAFMFHLSIYFFKIILFCSSFPFFITNVLLFNIRFLKKFAIIFHLWKYGLILNKVYFVSFLSNNFFIVDLANLVLENNSSQTNGRV